MPELLNNRYRIIQILATGGCGQTFLAEDAHMPSLRKCVIKQLKPATQNSGSYRIIKQRFEREAAILEITSKLSAQIPTLYAYFTENHEFYLVQDWIDGKNLEQLVEEQGCLSEPQVRAFLLSILKVLDVVHSQGIIHRDLKPGNIMVRKQDNLPILIDFGAVKEIVAKTTNELGTDTVSNSTTTIVIGSPSFMPPEQGLGHPEFASDVYSLGLTAIFMLTGKMPYEWKNTGALNTSWRAFAPNVSNHLAGILNRATEPKVQDRFASAKEMLQALEPETIVPPSPWPISKPQPQIIRRGISPLVLILLLVVDALVLIGASAGIYGYFYTKEQSVEKDAKEQLRLVREEADRTAASAGSFKQQADEGAKIKQAVLDGKIYRVVQIKNNTDLTVKYSVLNPDGEWWEGSVDPGRTNQHSRQNQGITVKFDSSLSTNYAWKKYELSITPIIGHPPTDAEKNAADLYYFDKRSTSEIDLYSPKKP